MSKNEDGFIYIRLLLGGEKMAKDQQEEREFLEQQLEWSNQQVRILDEIDMKLHKMKRIVEYAIDHELSGNEINILNTELYDLQNEVQLLEEQLQSVVH